MPVAEIENAAREMIGFSPYDETTDRGEVLEIGFRYIHDHGWPGDETLTISSWRSVTLDETPDVIARRNATEAWVMLPMNEDGDDYDWSDAALDRNAEGKYAHAILIVEANQYGFTAITWGRPQGFSWAWARKYLGGAYETVWEDNP